MNTPIVDAAPGRNSRQRWLASTVITLTLASLFTASNLAAPTGASADTVTTTYEENDPDIVYTGNWRQMAADSDSGEEAIYLNSPGTASLTFTGTEVSWISRTSPTSGKNNVYIDGVRMRTVDRYSPEKQFNSPVFTALDLSPGTHTIELRWIGTMNEDSETANLLLDAFVVTSSTSGTPQPSPEPEPEPSPEPTPSPEPDPEPTPAPVAPATGSGAAEIAIESVTPQGITVTWARATTSPSAYDVQRSTNGQSFSTIATVSAGTTSYSDVSAMPGTRTSYRIAAVNSTDDVTSTSASVSAVAKGVPAGTGRRYNTCPDATATVSTSKELKSALWNARSGSVIKLQPGTYRGTFSASKSGTADDPIWICGPRSAILTSGNHRSGHAFSMENKHDIVLAGMTIRDSFKGVTVINSDRITVTDLLVERIGYEAIHLRAQTADSEVTYNTIRKTGLVRDEFGEGIYIGTSDSNWCKYNGCQPDRTDRTLVLGNTISETGAQAIEAKAGTSDGIIARNNIVGYSPGSSSGEGWVLIKGNDWLIADNAGRNSPQDGFATNGSVSGWGKDNIFVRNSASNTAEFGVWIHRPNNVDLKNKVSCNNSTSSARNGSMNVDCLK